MWIPDDSAAWTDAAGNALGPAEVEANSAHDVRATTEGVTMDEKGRVQVLAAPVDVDKF